MHGFGTKCANLARKHPSLFDDAAKMERGSMTRRITDTRRSGEPLPAGMYRRKRSMRIAIVDDYAPDAKTLEDAIRSHLDKRGRTYEICCFRGGGDLFEAADALAFDLVFLDVFLDGANGIDIAERLRRENYPGLIIFTTVSSDYAVDGFRVRAFHYLTKPFTPDDIAAALDEAIERLAGDETMLRIHDGSAVINVPLSQVRSITTDGHYLNLNTVNGPLRWRQSFGRLADMVAPYPQLFACNRGIMVNLAHVNNLTDDGCFLMDDGSKLPVRRSSRAEARSRYFDHLFTHMRR